MISDLYLGRHTHSVFSPPLKDKHKTKADHMAGQEERQITQLKMLVENAHECYLCTHCLEVALTHSHSGCPREMDISGVA